MMHLNNLKLFFRTLSQKKVFSIISIGGYALSMAVILLMVIYIVEEKNANKCFSNYEKIYRLKRNEDAKVPQSLLEDVKGQIPGIEKMCMYSISPYKSVYEIDSIKGKATGLASNDDFLDMFSFEFIFQSSESSFKAKDHIILTKSFSETLFGNKNPVGEFLKLDYQEFKIVGVINDPPKNSSFAFDYIKSLEKGYAHHVGSTKDNTHHKLFKSFVLVQDNSDIENISKQFTEHINHWQLFKEDDITLQPLKEIYFDTQTQDDLSHANSGMIYLISSIALVILFMAIFNYVNLTISSGYDRLKEIGIKKTAGAYKRDVFNQFLTESFLTTLLAIIFAVFISSAIAPILSGILGKDIKIDSALLQPEILVIGFFIFLFTGIISGIFPALTFSRLTPLQVMNQKLNKKSYAGNGGIIALQFIITIALIISVLLIKEQIAYMKNKDLGFDKELIVRVKLDMEASTKSDVFKEKLLANPKIVSVSGSRGSMMQFEGTGTAEVDRGGETKLVDWRMFGIDDNFVDLFGLKIIKGKNIDCSIKDFTCLINESYYKYLEWDNLDGKKVLDQFNVVGVVEDFHFDVLQREIGFLVMEKNYGAFEVMNIKISENITESLEFIKKCYREIEPSLAFDFTFYDDLIQSMYEKEEKQAKAVNIFALFAIIISCLGLIGLTEHSTKKRTKEIGVRKVNGARITEILALLNKSFINWIAISFIIACPIAWFAISKWLLNFAYKTEISWWIFALAGTISLVIALITVSWQSWRAASGNLVEALRYE